MGRCIIKIEDKYLIWSSVVDAPITYLMGIEELRAVCMDYYTDMQSLDSDVWLADSKGCSSRMYTKEQLFEVAHMNDQSAPINELEYKVRFRKPDYQDILEENHKKKRCDIFKLMSYPNHGFTLFRYPDSIGMFTIRAVHPFFFSILGECKDGEKEIISCTYSVGTDELMYAHLSYVSSVERKIRIINRTFEEKYCNYHISDMVNMLYFDLTPYV